MKFLCPDKQIISTADCIAQCRLNSRCCSVPFLKLASRERVHKNNTISVTECLNGTRYNYYNRTIEKVEDPRDATFRLLGTSAHGILEMLTPDEQAEISLSYELEDDLVIEGHCDYYCNGEVIDFKTSGGFKVKKWLDGDYSELVFQLNSYRIMLQSMGKRVDKLTVQATPRDAGAMCAKMYKVTENIYMIDIPIVDDEGILTTWYSKASELKEALVNKSVPGKCNSVENWDGKKCKKYCPFAEQCKKDK